MVMAALSCFWHSKGAQEWDVLFLSHQTPVQHSTGLYVLHLMKTAVAAKIVNNGFAVAVPTLKCFPK